MKRSIVAGLVVVLCFSLFAIWFFLRPSSHTSEISASDTPSATSLQQCSAANGKDFSAAYQVHATVVSKLNQKLVYQSDISFNTQLQQATATRVFGKASNIQITETVTGQPARQTRRIDRADSSTIGDLNPSL